MSSDLRNKLASLRRLVEASRDGFLDGVPYILTYSDIIEGLREVEALLKTAEEPHE